MDNENDDENSVDVLINEEDVTDNEDINDEAEDDVTDKEDMNDEADVNKPDIIDEDDVNEPELGNDVIDDVSHHLITKMTLASNMLLMMS